MGILNNGIVDSATGVIALSGLGARMSSMTISKLGYRYHDIDTALYTFSKPGHQDDNRGLCFSYRQLSEDILNAIDKVTSSHDRLLLVGNSFTTPSIIEITKKFRLIISGMVLLSPSLVPLRSIENVSTFPGFEDVNTNEEVFSEYCRQHSVVLDKPDEVIAELTDFTKPLSTEIPTCEIFINPNDRVNAGTYSGLSRYGNITHTPHIRHDPTFHNISIDYIGNRQLLCEDSVN